MSKLSVTNFSRRTGSPFQNKCTVESKLPDGNNIVLHQEVTLQKSSNDAQKEKQHQLQEKVNKRTAEIQASKTSYNDGCFVEVVSHGAFRNSKNDIQYSTNALSSNNIAKAHINGSTNSKSLVSYPSSANDLALEAKTDLESDKNISEEVKDKVIKKLFTLVSMVQHMYESKIRIMTEYDKFKEKQLRDESRRERDHSEQLYKLNINFQSEVVQAIQQLKTELDITRSLTQNVSENSHFKDGSMDFSCREDDGIVTTTPSSPNQEATTNEKEQTESDN